MKDVDDYLRVVACSFDRGLSKRAAARRLGIDSRTVTKMMTHQCRQGSPIKAPNA